MTGGTLPVALAADWLVSAWDQNSMLRYATPGTAAVEEAAAGWVLDLLGLPAAADVGFVTGATMANFTGLAAGRQQVLGDAGWDLDRLGLTGAPRVRTWMSGSRWRDRDVMRVSVSNWSTDEADVAAAVDAVGRAAAAV